MKTCLGCGESKETARFYRTAKGREGLDSQCKQCRLQKQREYLEGDAITRRAKQLAAGFRKSGHPTTMTAMRTLLGALAKCPYCDEQMVVDAVSVDHKTPLSRGGSHDLDNLHVVCMPCNAAKGNMLHEQFMELMTWLRTRPDLLVAVRSRMRASGLIFRVARMTGGRRR